MITGKQSRGLPSREVKRVSERVPDSDYMVRLRTHSRSLIFQWPCENFVYMDRRKTVGDLR